MFSNELYNAEHRAREQVNERRYITMAAAQQARQLYGDLLTWAWLARVWSALLRRPRRLPTLAEVAGTIAVQGRHALGVRTIPIGRIYGSEGRSKDFDAAFRPTQHHTRARWLSVATAMIEGLAIPPIEVVQLGDRFFVRDGHHRVSVARALGQDEIEASVTIWDATPAPAAETLECQAVAMV